MERLLYCLVEGSAPCVHEVQRRLEGMEERIFLGLLPLGVVTGFFGMNFMSLPGPRHPFGWLFALGGMAVMAGGMLWAFRRRGWL